LLNRASDRITPSAKRQRAAGQTGAGAARDDRHFMFAADPQHRLRLFQRFRQTHRQRHCL
jgi:hypothetical protein